MVRRLLTADEVAALFRVGVPTVNRWAREGVLPVVRVPGIRKQMFRSADIERLVEDEPERIA